MSRGLSLLRRQWIEVACSGELVILILGNASVSIEFPLALKLAASMRYQARLAKVNAGRDERGFHMAGVLHDAAAEKPKRKRFIERLPDVLRPAGLDISTEGQFVVLKVKPVTVNLPYDTALTLSQWLRVRGREAKRNAGEIAHWSEIARVGEAMNGAWVW